MASLDDLPPLREIIARDQLSNRKEFGQHFLLDLNITRKIARQAPLDAESTVIEIGPGPGGLTRALLESPAKRIIVIEKDRRFLPALEELKSCAPDRLFIIEDDALKVDINALCEGPTYIIANLPYNITSALFIQWLPVFPRLAGMIVMIQKEVADRLVAKPGSKDYGRLGVLLQSFAMIQKLFNVDRAAFVPPPKVTSAVIKMTPRQEPLLSVPPAFLARVTQAAFHQRRKMIKTSLKSIFPNLEDVLTRHGLDSKARAENLSIEDYAMLAEELAKQQDQDTD